MAPYTDLTQRAPVCWSCAPTGTPHRPAVPAPVASEIPALRNPDELFHAAREQGALVCLEQACLDEGLRTWRSVAGRLLFLNLSAFAVVEMVDRLSAAGVARALEAAGVPP